MWRKIIRPGWGLGHSWPQEEASATETKRASTRAGLATKTAKANRAQSVLVPQQYAIRKKIPDRHNYATLSLLRHDLASPCPASGEGAPGHCTPTYYGSMQGRGRNKSMQQQHNTRLTVFGFIPLICHLKSIKIQRKYPKPVLKKIHMSHCFHAPWLILFHFSLVDV